jgi:hypothetical protein
MVRRTPRIASILAVALGVLLSHAPAGAKQSSRAQVQTAFRGFLRALADRDADAGVALLSAASLVEWQRDRQLALTAPRAEVEALPPGRRLVVLALRHHAPDFLARDGSPRELASHAIRAGMVDREGAARVELADVVLREERAAGDILAGGFPSTFRAVFVHEAGAWKLDLPATLEAAGRVITRAAAASDASEDSVIAGLLTLSSGRRPTTKIWQPLR